MTRKYFLVLLMFLLIPGAMAGVSVDFDEDQDFSAYKTFSWHESDMTVKDSDPLGHERLVQAIEGQLRAKGFQKESSNASSDVVVTYSVEESEQMTLSTTYMGTGWGMGAGMGMGRGNRQ